jgi:hypothetical protein
MNESSFIYQSQIASVTTQQMTQNHHPGPAAALAVDPDLQLGLFAVVAAPAPHALAGFALLAQVDPLVCVVLGFDPHFEFVPVCPPQVDVVFWVACSAGCS